MGLAASGSKIFRHADPSRWNLRWLAGEEWMTSSLLLSDSSDYFKLKAHHWRSWGQYIESLVSTSLSKLISILKTILSFNTHSNIQTPDNHL